MSTPPVLYCFHPQRLRLRDNPALQAALKTQAPLLLLFVWDPASAQQQAPGSASRWWMHQSLAALDQDLRQRGNRLLIALGKREQQAQRLAKACLATAIHFESGPSLLLPTLPLLNGSDLPYRVFTPFMRASLAQPLNLELHEAPKILRSPTTFPASTSLNALNLLDRKPWWKKFENLWEPGEHGASNALKRFAQTALGDYVVGRNVLASHGNSKLSARLHFGEISPGRAWNAAERMALGEPTLQGAATAFQRQLLWRDFGHHLLTAFPHTAKMPLDDRYNSFPWRHDPAALQAWQTGTTGYPVVDAGMRELWATGTMHNRARMIVASFLVKDLLLDWRLGAAWFEETLLDADIANNTLGWQWAAGCGADAAPYFRIFNPTLQGQKFDPKGAYVRRWVPELNGADYPLPIVDHKLARQRALDVFGEHLRN